MIVFYMPQLTIDLTEAAMPWLTRRAENENTTPEKYLTAHVLFSMAQEENVTIDSGPAQKQLEDILEERDKGPFIEITDLAAYRRDLRARVTERVEQYRHA